MKEEWTRGWLVLIVAAVVGYAVIRLFWFVVHLFK